MEKASDKIVNKWLFWNTRTEAVVILDGKETGFAFMDKGRSVQELEYSQEFEQTDWDSFYERNNYNLEGKEGTTFYTESLNSAAGGVGITIDCEALPQENDILYTRFPELEKWKGAEGREAIIWVGGYPTVEEIMAMFEKQEL